MRNLKVAVVGLGFIASRRHLPLWKKQGNVEIKAVCDMSEQMVADAQSRFDIPNGYTDLAQMIDEIQPDIIDLCTPPKTHLSLATMAMEKGVNVLVEKPMAMTSEECRQLVESSKENGVKLSVIHNMLYYPPVMRALEMTRNGDIGEFRGMRLLIANPVEEYLGKDGWVHKLPGGLIGETGPHVAYLSLAFIGKVHKVYAHSRKMSDFEWAQADDFVIDLVGERGTSSIRVIHNSNHWAGDLEVWGSEGKLRVDLQGMTLERISRETLESWTVGRSVIRESVGNIADTMKNAAMVATGRFKTAHETIITEFARSVAEDTPVPVTPESAADAVEVLERIVSKMETDEIRSAQEETRAPVQVGG